MTAAWRDFAACLTVSPDVFFPDPARYDLVQAAKQVCAACPVTAHCLNLAFLVGADAGIWAGTTPEERMTMLRRREAVA